MACNGSTSSVATKTASGKPLYWVLCVGEDVVNQEVIKLTVKFAVDDKRKNYTELKDGQRWRRSNYDPDHQVFKILWPDNIEKTVSDMSEFERYGFQENTFMMKTPHNIKNIPVQVIYGPKTFKIQCHVKFHQSQIETSGERSFLGTPTSDQSSDDSGTFSPESRAFDSLVGASPEVRARRVAPRPDSDDRE